MTFDEEYYELIKLFKLKEFRRYGDDLYTKYCFDWGYEWKFEYNICELVWGFCKNPCFAKGLIKQLEKDIIDMNIFVKVLAKSNKAIKPEKLCNRWDSAMDLIELNDYKTPVVVYSTENSHIWTDKKIVCDDVDGELWHGILMTEDFLSNLGNICIELSGRNIDNDIWEKRFVWDSCDLMNSSRVFEDNVYIFTPFKHPLILLNSGLEVSVSFNFVDGRLPKEGHVKIIYGVCNSSLKDWIENPTTTFTTELAFGHKISVDTSNGIIDEL